MICKMFEYTCSNNQSSICTIPERKMDCNQDGQDLVLMRGVLVRGPSDMFLRYSFVGQDTLACGAPQGRPTAGQVTRSQHPVDF